MSTGVLRNMFAQQRIAANANATSVSASEVEFRENGAGVYTGSVRVPGGATILDVIVHAVALWTAGTSAAMIVGDATDPNGIYDDINLKATDLLAGESLSFAQSGGQAGADNIGTDTHWGRRYSATDRVITGVITSVGAGTGGRTRMTVVYTMPLGAAKVVTQ